MKIAIDCRMSGKSGIGTFLDEILPYFFESEYSFFLFGSKESKAEKLFKNLKNKEKVIFEECNIKTFSIKESFSFPESLLKKINSCDVYFTPYCNIPGGIKIPVFSTIHDVVFLDVKGLTGFTGTFIRKVFYKNAVKKSKALFTVSDFSKKRIQKKLNCKKEINVVYNGIPSYLEEKISNDKNIKKNDTLIFIGNIKKHKGLKTLLKAFPDFCKEIEESSKNTKAKLIIVGSQDNFRTKDTGLKELIDKIPKEQIEFTGFISNEELKKLLSSSRILVQPSLYEGFGIPPLQALCAKTQAVISDIEVFKEIYKDLPVTFFECENPIDLKEKLVQVWNKEKDLSSFKNPYSYKKTASLILQKLAEK